MIPTKGLDSPAGAVVERLTLTRFRSHENLRLDGMGQVPVVLTGPNGAGKTNLLEALSFLAPGRGLRGAGLGDVARWGAAEDVRWGATEDARWDGTGAAPQDSLVWAVAARLRLGPRDAVEVGTGYETLHRTMARDRRVVQIDGQVASGHGALGVLFPVLWLTPDMDPLFRGPAQDRRRFLDRLVAAFDPDHTGRSSAYARAQRERLKLLRSDRPNPAWLDALEDVMARYGVALVAARRDLVDRLGAALAQGEGPFPGVRLDLASEVDGWLAGGPALAVEDRLRERFAAQRRQDGEREITTSGPQRDDFLAFHGTSGAPADQSSTGEQKAMLIALLLAQSRVLAAARGIAPLLLLDDVAAHLDLQRRAALFDALETLGAQTWVTGTDPQAFDTWKKTAQFFRLESGAVVS